MILPQNLAHLISKGSRFNVRNNFLIRMSHIEQATNKTVKVKGELSLKCFLFVLFKKIVYISINLFFPPPSLSGFSLFNCVKPTCPLYHYWNSRIKSPTAPICLVPWPPFYFFPSNHIENLSPFLFQMFSSLGFTGNWFCWFFSLFWICLSFLFIGLYG